MCLRFRVAFEVMLVLGERVSGLRFLYNSYSSALVDRHGAWMSELDSACLKLDTVHFSIGGNAGLVDRYDDAGNWLVFSSEKARWSLGVLEDEWLGESRAVREKEPGARLRDCAGKDWIWSRLAAGMLPERWIRLLTRKY